MNSTKNKIATDKKRKLSTTTVKKNTSQVIGKIIIYLLLIEFVFVFIYPFLHMLINSFKFEQDFWDLNRQWVLTGLNIENYKVAFEQLDYSSTVWVNVALSVLSTIGHIVSCSFIAYGVSRFDFFGKSVVFGFIILSIVIPPQIFSMPLHILFSKVNWIGTLLPIIIPSFFGFGLKGGLFIYIFMQFFKGLPKSYEEAAKIEGCGSFRVFFQIIIPMSKMSILVVGTLSMIWHWTDEFEPAAYLTKNVVKTLSQRLEQMPGYLFQITSANGMIIRPVELAACVLIILPILILFAFTQKHFVQGVEFTGLAN